MPLDELEELRRMHDRVRDPGLGDQLLLCDLGAEVAALREPLGSHDRQRDVMADIGRRFCREQGARRRLEELQDGGGFERGGVGHVDDDRGTFDDLGHALTRQRVDARVGGRRHRVVIARAEVGDELGSDEAGSAYHHDLHRPLTPSVFGTVAETVSRIVAETLTLCDRG